MTFSEVVEAIKALLNQDMNDDFTHIQKPV